MADIQNGMDGPSRKESNCVRCRNHGMKSILRGHKQYCIYASCSCDKCKFTAEQQRQMRLQNSIRRAEAHDRSGPVNVAKRARELASPTMVPQQQVQQITSQQPQVVTLTLQSDEPTTNGTSNDDKKTLFDCSSELLKKFRYPWEMMPVMYALAKYANGDMEEVLQKIDEGQFAVNEQVRLQTLNLYFQQQQQQSNNNSSSITAATRECG